MHSPIGGRGRRSRRREAELLERNQALAAVQERLTKLLAHAEDAVIIVSDDDPMLWASPGFTRLLGWDAPIHRLDAAHLVHPDDMSRMVAAVQDVRERRVASVDLVIRVRHRDGRFLMTKQILTDHRNDTDIAGLVLTFRDVTEQHGLVATLTEQVDRYRFLAEHAVEVLIIASAAHVITSATSSTARVLGRCPTELVGMHVADLVHIDDRALVEAALVNTAWTSDTSTVDVRVERSAHGTHSWVQLAARCIIGPVGDRQYHVSLRDISVRRDAESAMAESERRFRGLAAQTRELVLMIDLQGAVTYVSPSVRDVLGHDPQHAVGQNIAAYLHHDERSDLVHRIIELSTIDALRHRALHADGTYRWLETLAQVMTDQTGARQSFMLSSRDITERLALEQRLDRERARLDAILDNVHAAVVAVDRHGMIFDANHAFCQLLGADFAAGTSILDYVTTHRMLDEFGRDVPVHDRPLEVALAGGTVSDRCLVVVPQDGTRRQVIANASALLDEDGHIEGAVLTYEDVTALRAAQHELHRMATASPN
jgi:PAS domain S-box-containing protein